MYRELVYVDENDSRTMFRGLFITFYYQSSDKTFLLKIIPLDVFKSNMLLGDIFCLGSRERLERSAVRTWIREGSKKWNGGRR